MTDCRSAYCCGCSLEYWAARTDSQEFWIRATGLFVNQGVEAFRAVARAASLHFRIALSGVALAEFKADAERPTDRNR
jgi:hypothetical protein